MKIFKFYFYYYDFNDIFSAISLCKKRKLFYKYAKQKKAKTKASLPCQESHLVLFNQLIPIKISLENLNGEKILVFMSYMHL